MKSKHEVGNSRVYMMDCMEFMKDLPDGYFHLACVDPEYGIGISKNPFRQKHDKKDWDSKPPSKKYFDELFRVCKNQIIWGGNYFDLPPSQGFLIWDKVQPHDFSSAMCEMAWMSYQKPAKIFRKHVVTAEKNKIHICQKPIKLYDWIFKNYLPDGGKVFDSHLGSGSSRIAADKAGNIDFTGTEIDEDYFKASVDRFNKYKSQLTLF